MIVVGNYTRYFTTAFLALLHLFAYHPIVGQTSVLEQRMEGPEVCSLPKLGPGFVLHVFRVRALATGPTDGTYADSGKGQGEFVTVQLLTTLVSPVNLRRNSKFRIHAFPGAIDDAGSPPAERLLVGKTYLIVTPYYLRRTPKREDVIGLTRCGVLEDTPENVVRLLSLSDTAQAQGQSSR